MIASVGRRLAAEVFESQAEPGAGSWRGAVGTALIAAVLLVWRGHVRLRDGFLWAEDALVFMKGAIEVGAPALLDLWGGYVVLVPRLLAWALAETTPVALAPYAYVWATFVLTVGCTAVTYGALRRTVCADRPATAAAMSVLPLAIPHSGEVYLTITNFQWVVAPTLVALCLDAFWWGRMPRSILPVLFVLALTGPFAVLLLPLGLLGVALRRSLTLAGLVWCVAVAIQVVAMRASDVPSPTWVDTHWIELFWADFLLGAFLPMHAAHPLSRSEWLAAFAVGGGILAAVAFTRDRAVGGLLLGFAGAVWVLGVMRVHQTGFCLRHLGDGARYLFVPTVCVGWALLLACGRGRPRWAATTAAALLALLGLSTLQAPRMLAYEPWTVRETESGRHLLEVAPAGFETVIVEPTVGRGAQ